MMDEKESTETAAKKTAAKKTAVGVAPSAPIKTAARVVRHIVLKERRGEAWHPLLSCEHDDPDADDLIAAEKIERINVAKRSGAPPPGFRIVHEIEGEEVRPL